jgi:hypothetical protein
MACWTRRGGELVGEGEEGGEEGERGESGECEFRREFEKWIFRTFEWRFHARVKNKNIIWKTHDCSTINHISTWRIHAHI